MNGIESMLTKFEAETNMEKAASVGEWDLNSKCSG